MAEIVVEKHIIASPNESPAGVVISAESAPGAVEIIIWGEGVRLRARLMGAEALNGGVNLILAGGQAMAIAAGLEAPPQRIVTANGGRS